MSVEVKLCSLASPATIATQQFDCQDVLDFICAGELSASWLTATHVRRFTAQSKMHPAQQRQQTWQRPAAWQPREVLVQTRRTAAAPAQPPKKSWPRLPGGDQQWQRRRQNADGRPGAAAAGDRPAAADHPGAAGVGQAAAVAAVEHLLRHQRRMLAGHCRRLQPHYR